MGVEGEVVVVVEVEVEGAGEEVKLRLSSDRRFRAGRRRALGFESIRSVRER